MISTNFGSFSLNRKKQAASGKKEHGGGGGGASARRRRGEAHSVEEQQPSGRRSRLRRDQPTALPGAQLWKHPFMLFDKDFYLYVDEYINGLKRSHIFPLHKGAV